MSKNTFAGTLDEISNPNDVMLPNDGSNADHIGMQVVQDPYSITDVLNQGPGKPSTGADDPLIEDIVNPSLDPEVLSPVGSTSDAVSPLFQHPSIGYDQIIHRASPPANSYHTSNTPGGLDRKVTNDSLSSSLNKESYQTSRTNSGPDLSVNQNGYDSKSQRQSQSDDRKVPHQPIVPLHNRRLLSKAHGDKPHGKKNMSTTRTRPAFVNKLWSMVNDPSNEKYIHWSENGESIIVPNRERLVQEVLPKYFKHSNFASFVRQLNMYGWHKVQDVKSGSMLSSNDSRWEFENENFKRDREYLIENIVRQKPNSGITGNNSDEVDINILLNEVETVKYNQLAIAEDLKRIAKDNKLLWKENMLAREKHQSQQQVLEKILRFLSSVFGPNAGKTIDSGFQPDLIHELGAMQVHNNSNSNNVNSTGNAPMSHNFYTGEDDAAANMFRPMSPVDQSKLPPDHKIKPRLLLKSRSTSSSSSNLNNSQADFSPSPMLQPQYPYVIPDANRSPVSMNQPSRNQLQALAQGNGDMVPSVSGSETPDPAFFQDLQNNIDRQEESIQEIQDWITKLSPGDDANTPIFPDLNLPQNFSNVGSLPLQTSELEELQNAHSHVPEFDSEEDSNPGRKKRRTG